MREKDSGGSCSSHTPATHATGSAAVSVPQWSAVSTIDVIAMSALAVAAPEPSATRSLAGFSYLLIRKSCREPLASSRLPKP